MSESVTRGLASLGQEAPVTLGVIAGAGVALLGFWVVGQFGVGPFLALAGLTMVLLATVLISLAGYFQIEGRAKDAQTLRLAEHDAASWFATDPAGRVLFQNAAANRRCGTRPHALGETLGRFVIDPAALLFRLQRQAEDKGAAQADLSHRQGSLRVSVHRDGPARYLWRLEDFPGTAAAPGAALPHNEPGSAGPGNVSDSSPVLGADLEDVPVALMTFGPDGLLRNANRAARDMLLDGMLRPAMFHELFEALGRPVSDWLGDVASGRIAGGNEVLRARNGGDEAFVQVTLHRFLDAGRVSVLAVLNDATRIKTLEAQFAQSQKMQAIGQLAGGIAHDFNNLLTAISGHCDLLLLRHGRDAPDFADLEQIRQNANRAAALVGQLLAFSRKQTLKPERLDVQDVLAELTHLLNRLLVERVELKLDHLRRDHGADLCQIRADRRQLEQVLVNLVVNARDAMPDGGLITIETSAVTLTEALLRDRASVPPGDYCLIRVIDCGIGILPENLRKIFEPFFTTKRLGEGTGLGLSMAYGIVKQSGGFIFAQSEPGRGTIFELYFPSAGPELATIIAAPEPRRTPVRQGDGVVLLVEDEAPVRAFASRALRLRGYTVLEAASGEEALEVLRDHSLEVDVFVSDVVMPGLDGPAWVRQALQARPQVRVIFMSGYAEDALSEDQARVPNAVFLPKPFSLNELTATVQAQFG